MPPEREAEGRAARLGPESIARATFPISRRGFDQQRVRALLEEVANELRAARERESVLRTEVQSLESRLADASGLDEDRLTAVLGEETARVLTTARAAAAEIKEKASENAARLLREAQEEAAALREQAESLLARRTEEAEAEAARIRDSVTAEVERLVAEAKAAGEAEIEAAKARGREMIDEALLVRSRVLEDLARKRKVARAQVERLQAGRERLLESYAIVRRTLEEATAELDVSLVAAKIAADDAARRVEAEGMPTPAEMEREVQAAREAGMLTPEPSEEPAVSEELVPIEAPAEFEEVRLVAQAPPPAPEPSAPEPPAPEPPATESSAEEPVAQEPAEEAAPEAASDATADAAPAEQAPVDVDDLFARIRAAREAEVALAQQVLADGDSAPAGDKEPPPAAEEDAEPNEGEPEPVEVEADAEPAEGPVAAEPDDQALLERRDGITELAERQCVRKLKRVLADEQNEVLDRLRRSPKTKIADLFPPASEHAERYASAIRAELVQVARAGGGFYGGEPAKTDVADLALELGRALTTPLRDRIDSALRE